MTIRALIALLLLVSGARAAVQPDHPSVNTRAGAVEGRLENGAAIFRGIPYAAPPVGPLRWKPPHEPAPWVGVRDAGAFGPSCMQPKRDVPGRGAAVQSEDCLSLNVWAPMSATKAPVMVWIHGGAFRYGASSLSYYDGARFARSGVILVSINYRIGGFGFFAHPALREKGGEDRDAANFGLLDQIAALNWIRENIAAFGGDPDNVTVFGESAGGASILYLMTSDKAHGLFHKAIVQSGGGQQSAACAWRACAGKAAASDAAVAWAAAHLDGVQTPDNLRSLSAEAVNRYAQTTSGMGFGPVIDDHSIVGNIYERMRAGKMEPIPLIIGANSNEAGLMESFRLAPTTVFDLFGPAIEQARMAYSVSKNGLSEEDFAKALFRDALFNAPAKIIAGEMSAGGVPVWRYYYDYVLERRRDRQSGANHGSEIPMVFDTLDSLPASRLLVASGDRDMAANMHALWASFARAGTPQAPGVDWKTVDDRGMPVLVFGPEETTLEYAFQKEELEFQERLFRARRSGKADGGR